MKKYCLRAKDLIGLNTSVPVGLENKAVTLICGLNDLAIDIDWRTISNQLRIDQIILSNQFAFIPQQKLAFRNLEAESTFLNRFASSTKSLRLYIRNKDAYFLDDYLMLAEALGIEDILVFADGYKVSLDHKQSFHTQQFLYKMLTNKALGRDVKMYYRFLREQLMKGLDLPKAQGKEVLLYSEGRFQAQKVAALDSAATIPLSYKIHRASLSLAGKLSKGKKESGLPFSNGRSKNEDIKCDPRTFKKVIITGWYGTETNGDKGIIGEVLYFLKACSPDIQFLVTTIQEDISLQTNLELELLQNAQLIPLSDAADPSLIESCDAVIIGGGPLMESASLVSIAKMFELADSLGKAKIVFGCGIGPIHTQTSEFHIKTIIELADQGFVRDTASLDLGKTLVPELKFEVACDPALAFVRRWYLENKSKIKKKEGAVACLVRSNTNEFSPDVSAQELQRLNQETANNLASIVNGAPANAFTDVRLLQMNAPHVGGDDRIFNRLIATAVKDQDKVLLYRNYMDIEEQMRELAQCDYALAMRFHGHIFSIAMEIPFLSIDYTGKGGKVESLVQRINHTNYSVKWSKIDTALSDGVLNLLLSNKVQISEDLGKEADKLVSLLHEVYFRVFNVKVTEINY
jgi:polysaccharide pyruvyl transferase WcaK-like protein